MIETLWTGSQFGQQVADDRVAELVVGGDEALLLATSPGVFFSGPAITRMIPSSSSSIVISRLPERAVSSADSLIRFARSAPVKPGVWPASASRSICLASGLPRVWTSRIFLRPLRSGRSTTIWRSKRPGRSSAGSRMSGRLVAAIRMMLSFIVEPVHLDEELVQGLLALVVAAAHAGAAMAADGVDLVHEDDAGGVLLRLLEQVADAARADADEHLDEVRAGDREERHARPRRRRRGRAASCRCRAARRAARPSGSGRRAPGTSSGSRGTP